MPDEITTASTASIKTIKNLKTDQIIYPVTKANAVYLNSTVEGEGETPVLQTVQGKLNDTRDDLDFWIKNDGLEASTVYPSDGYYIRIGANKKGNGYAPPFVFMDLRDLGDTSETDSGALKANLLLTSNIDASKRHNNAFLTNADIRCVFQGGSSDNYASLRNMVGKATLTGLPAITSVEQLDNLRNNVIYYAPSIGITELGLPFSNAMIWQYAASGSYKIQFAAQYNSLGWIISRSMTMSSGWSNWKTILQNDKRGSITGTSNLSNGTSGFSWSQTNGVCILTMMPILKAMTYTSSTPLFTVPSAPYPNTAGYIRFMAITGSTPRDLKLNRETGVVTFNNSVTFSSTTYLIGQLVYPYAVSQ